MQCPFCHHTDVHRSKHRGPIEWLITRGLRKRYMRCDDCHKRFLKPAHLVLSKAKSAKSEQAPGA